MTTIRVVIADDHPVFREGMRSLLAADPTIDVVAEAETGSEAIDAVQRLDPDVVVMDVGMPDVDGIEATRRLTSMCPGVPVLMMTMHEDDESVLAAIRSGAVGYIVKRAAHSDVVRAVRAAAQGESTFSAPVAKKVLDYVAGRSQAHAAGGAFPQLTGREVEVLDLVARGYSNDVIARRLVISGKTLRNHISNVFRKLEVSSRSEAIVVAREAGLGI